MGAPVVFGAGPIGIDDLVAVAAGRAIVVLDTAALDRIGAARAIVERHLVGAAAASIGGRSGTHGFDREPGGDRDASVDGAELIAFQHRIVQDQRGGVGRPLSEDRARAVVAARLAGWTRGGSGIRLETAVFTAELLNRGVVPVIPSIGSVGEADPTHLAAFAALAIGEGDALLGGDQLPATVALSRVGLAPLELAIHEGLALVNHNAYALGVGALAIDRLGALSRVADTTTALSFRALEALGAGGNPSSFDAELLSRSPSLGAIESGARISELLGAPGDRPSARTQDPLAFRVAPQANGALVDQVAAAVSLLEATLGAAAENPLVDQRSGTLRSGGLFHVVQLAHTFDSLRAAIAHVATLAERRLATIADAVADGRRASPSRVPGLLGHSAVDLLAELRVLATPVAIGGAVLSGGSEDAASFAGTSLRLLERSIALLADVLALEAVVAVDALGAAPAPERSVAFRAVHAKLDAVIEDAPRGQALIAAALGALGVERS
ncbi:MAG TPA: aromatic amino acid lyase [Plantibacter sp.]|uniref:aromatic amino acid lyase n=1 Tax=unclassified Plantibacter TaxID=2624265 RepID=UPI002D1AE755|nr:aromatic amino acid lyase [Plantibacter sp.]